MEPKSNEKPPKVPASKQSKIIMWVSIAVGVILLAAIGYLIWLAMSLMSQNTALTKDKTDALSKVSSLTEQLAAAQKTSSSTTTTTACNSTPTTALKDTIHDAISSGNTAALEGYMASSVTVVIAASEKGGAESAAEAVADLNYVSSATDPWNFNIAAGTLTAWKAGSYKQYFTSTSYQGEAASKQAISFDFDCNGKINKIFMSVSSDLLTD